MTHTSFIFYRYVSCVWKQGSVSLDRGARFVNYVNEQYVENVIQKYVLIFKQLIITWFWNEFVSKFQII